MDADDALDFDLLIAPDSGGYRVRLLSSPAGTASSVFTLPFSDLEIENLVLRMGQVRAGLRRRESPQTEAAREFGRRLFEAVFGDELAACWQGSAAEAARAGKRLRLRLRLGDAPELLDLPWEYLYDNVANRFVALSSNTPIVRYLDLPGRVEAMPVSGPLRILALIASPQDAPPLDVEAEWRNLQNALADLTAQGLVQLDRCPQPTLPELQRTLRRQEVHIFHFVGHGGYDSREGDGVLLFEDDQRHSRPISGRQLGALLHDEGLLRLAVLNACEGARTSRTDPFAGVGQSLLQQGVPAVIAMQFAITDVAAGVFAHEFYAAVADGYSVDRSLAEARKAMFAQADSVEWGTPVLYLRAVEGRIFNLLALPRQPATPAQARAPAPFPGAAEAPAPSPVQPRPEAAAAPIPPSASSPASSPGQTGALAPAAAFVPNAPPKPAQPAASPPAGNVGAAVAAGNRSWLMGLLIGLAVIAAAAAVFFLLQGGAPGAAAPTAPAAAGASAADAEAQGAGVATAAATEAATAAATEVATAAATEVAAAASSQPAFRYTFDEGNAEGWTGEPGNWAVVQDETGNYIYEGAGGPDSDTASEPPSKVAMSTWRNYAVHLRLRVHQEGADPNLAEFWLTTRAPISDDVVGCSFYNSFLNFRTQLVVLAKGGNDASCDFIPLADDGFPGLTVGEWHDVLVTMQDEHLQVAVDGVEVVAAADLDADQGYVYLNVGPGAIVQFDDMEVYKLD